MKFTAAVVAFAMMTTIAKASPIAGITTTTTTDTTTNSVTPISAATAPIDEPVVAVNVLSVGSTETPQGNPQGTPLVVRIASWHATGPSTFAKKLPSIVSALRVDTSNAIRHGMNALIVAGACATKPAENALRSLVRDDGRNDGYWKLGSYESL
ncbi:hypothetical protein PT974_03882 [Cladobotryum mycophilum]|uniref:Uncharacterized protein n=1 Tax=Cladobotryum mycophilum TaxID=491253 RepID=A0ABR0STM8_9HYPO